MLWRLRESDNLQQSYLDISMFVREIKFLGILRLLILVVKYQELKVIIQNDHQITSALMEIELRKKFKS